MEFEINDDPQGEPDYDLRTEVSQNCGDDGHDHDFAQPSDGLANGAMATTFSAND
ncbi:hypothetical protein GRI44_04985 [Altererythrobacter confluentis]|uniref:Uncharacterized protein n=1 Tax=Allopontixanthobacter confluentis TaxID=1849021 RepID=A0A6L7GDG3_9SPHN|nr:hypothetical protein [Allopontixanthobacter confluentis]MXP14102.1 hypothetical protein [Allopontixanthobacter confluentis]